ncbi:MAG: dimethylmenaquinone methyltransferase [Acidobacteria bacterium]|nr:dimethylmenaquinone methyltransferase [Acidobacteriota bacterium]
MRMLLTLALCGALSLPALGQVFSLTKEQMIEFTKHNPYERFPDGRPKVPLNLIERIAELSVEEAWGVLRGKGYQKQYADGFDILKPGQRLVGRAVTAQYLPFRPDLEEVVDADAEKKGLAKGNTQKVVDVLVRDDVAVVDLMGAAPGHNFGGDNLHSAIWGQTHRGAVVDGTIRDLQGTFDLPLNIFYKKAHPAAVEGVLMVGLNIPVEISGAVAMPGDVVLGDREGVIFIPPHLVEAVLEYADGIHIKDEWTKAKLITGQYRASDLYGSKLSPEMQKDFDAFKARRTKEMKAERGEK